MPVLIDQPKWKPTKLATASVEDWSTGDKYVVNLDTGKCTCGAPKGKQCSHARTAIDVHRGGCREFRFCAVSALHKEIRRNNVESALYWADILARYSTDYVKYYVRQICAEETRNSTYFGLCVDPGHKNYRDLVAAVAASRKKWEHPDGYEAFSHQLRAVYRLNEEGYDADVSASQVRKKLKRGLARDDRAAIWDTWAEYYVRCDERGFDWRSFEAILADEIRARKLAIPHPMRLARGLPKATKRDNFELQLFFVEALTCGWDESMNEFHGADVRYPPSDGSEIRSFPDYVFDKHTGLGRQWLSNWGHMIKAGKPMPGRLDLRWSGQMGSVGWRYAAYRQFGSQMIDVPWEAVKMPSEYWRMARDYDEEGDDD